MAGRRGVARILADDTQLVLTFHPSYILRIRDPGERHAAANDLRRDLALAHRLSLKPE